MLYKRLFSLVLMYLVSVSCRGRLRYRCPTLQDPMSRFTLSLNTTRYSTPTVLEGFYASTFICFISKSIPISMSNATNENNMYQVYMFTLYGTLVSLTDNHLVICARKSKHTGENLRRGKYTHERKFRFHFLCVLTINSRYSYERR